MPSVIGKLKKVGAIPFKVDPDGAHHYKDLDYSQVSFRSGKKREMSDELKQKAADRMRNLHKNKATK